MSLPVHFCNILLFSYARFKIMSGFFRSIFVRIILSLSMTCFPKSLCVRVCVCLSGVGESLCLHLVPFSFVLPHCVFLSIKTLTIHAFRFCLNIYQPLRFPCTNIHKGTQLPVERQLINDPGEPWILPSFSVSVLLGESFTRQTTETLAYYLYITQQWAQLELCLMKAVYHTVGLRSGWCLWLTMCVGMFALFCISSSFICSHLASVVEVLIWGADKVIRS